ncbi:MAG: lactonase family protein [Deltaproteobacteria bacterium]|nr:lactonase family protein [Deltaproteobacteria bacterium]
MRLSAWPAVLSVAVLTACTASSNEVEPPEAQLFFPTGMALSPDESRLFIANANSDLHFNSGSINVIDLEKVSVTADAWIHRTGKDAPAGCTQDTDFSETAFCDASQYIDAAAGVRTGSFATAIGVQDKGDGNLRLLVPVRGDPSITWIEYDKASSSLRCSADTTGFALCDDAHRLLQLRNDSSLPALPSEPYDIHVDSGNQFAIVTHLTSGTVSLVDTPANGTPVLADAISGLFNADPDTNVVGATAVGGRTPGDPDGLVYVASRSENRIQTFGVVRQRDELPVLVPTTFFFLDGVGLNAGQSRDSRGIAFGDGGDRMYAINRRPPSLQVIDTSIGADGTPRHETLRATDICRQASKLVLADAGAGDHAYVSCFGDGSVFVIDPRSDLMVQRIVTVGRGPYDVVAAPSRRLLFVSNYLENTIAVIDLTPGAPTENQVVLRLGEPKKK